MDAVPAAGQHRLALRAGDRADESRSTSSCRSLGQLNSLGGVILAETGFLLPYAILILAPYFDCHPVRARGGRAHRWLHAPRAFVHIVLPLATPALAACGVIIFITSWHELLIPLILNARPDFMTLPVVIASLVGDVHVFFNLMMAICLLALAPTVILVALLQKYIVEGLAAGAIKG
jgi:multiple sugar transport system permease protein